MKKLLLAALISTSIAVPAHAYTAAQSALAPTTSSASTGGLDFTPTTTYDFEDGLRPTNFLGGGGVYSTTAYNHAKPANDGSTYYFAVGPDNYNGSDNSALTVDLSGFDAIGNVGMLLGSLDSYNDIDFVFTDHVVSFNGDDLTVPVNTANGDQISDSNNRWFSVTLTGSDQTNLTAIVFHSETTNALEFDNLAVAVVPETSAWASLLLGLGLAGAIARRRRSVAAVA